jgi:hypothetical protein
MQAHAIFVFTHDSIALGEDGPTHQPVEHLMSLRADGCCHPKCPSSRWKWVLRGAGVTMWVIREM